MLIVNCTSVLKVQSHQEKELTVKQMVTSNYYTPLLDDGRVCFASSPKCHVLWG